MKTALAEVSVRDTTDGLVSAYQVTQLTGAGLAAVMDTGCRLTISVATIPYRQVLVPCPVIEPPTSPVAPIEDWAGDPALAPFSGPLGVPRTHRERAALLRQNYRPAREETGYLDVPEDVL